MYRSAAARFRELLRPPQDQQRERAKDAVNGKRHRGKHWWRCFSAPAWMLCSAQMRCSVAPAAASPLRRFPNDTHVNDNTRARAQLQVKRWSYTVRLVPSGFPPTFRFLQLAVCLDCFCFKAFYKAGRATPPPSAGWSCRGRWVLSRTPRTFGFFS